MRHIVTALLLLGLAVRASAEPVEGCGPAFELVFDEASTRATVTSEGQRYLHFPKVPGTLNGFVPIRPPPLFSKEEAIAIARRLLRDAKGADNTDLEITDENQPDQKRVMDHLRALEARLNASLPPTEARRVSLVSARLRPISSQKGMQVLGYHIHFWRPGGSRFDSPDEPQPRDIRPNSFTYTEAVLGLGTIIDTAQRPRDMVVSKIPSAPDRSWTMPEGYAGIFGDSTPHGSPFINGMTRNAPDNWRLLLLVEFELIPK